MKKILKVYVINALGLIILIAITKTIVFLGYNSISTISIIGYLVGYMLYGINEIILESYKGGLK
jgi:hypothetical protein